MTSPATKRPRVGSADKDDSSATTTTSASILDPITAGVLQKGEELATLYQKASPYPHAVIDNFCVDGFLENILTELKHNSKVKFKETDLFRVYQSIDLVSNVEYTCHDVFSCQAHHEIIVNIMIY